MKCKDCLFWKCAGRCINGDPYNFGKCHKSPPLMFQKTKDISKGYEHHATVVTGEIITTWPSTKEDDWCGKFKPKTEKEQNNE